MANQTTKHIASEELELYSLKRLEEHRLPDVEEHLLVCPHCQERLAELDEYVHLMKSALPAVKAEETRAEAGWFQRLFMMPKPVWAGATAVAALLIVVPLYRQVSGPTADVYLSAVRSDAMATSAEAGSRLRLHLSREGVDPIGEVFATVVDSSGSEQWNGAAVRQNGHWLADARLKVSPGQYWVRVYADRERARLLREYPLTVR